MPIVSRQRRLALISGLFFLSLSTSSCSLTVDANRVQCTKTADCAARGAEFADATCVDSVCRPDPAWECLTATGGPPTPQQPPYRITALMRDLITQMPVAGAQARLCRKIDVDCLTPVGVATSDADGAVTFTVDILPVPFAGYISVKSEGSVPTLYFFFPDVDRDQTVPISLASPIANAGLLFQLGRAPSAGHGNIVISSQNCTGAPAAGVSYATLNGDAMTAPFYAVGMLPTLTATATDSGGYGGLIGVPIGAATVSTTLDKPHADLGTISLLVHEGAITYTRVLPVAK